MRLNITSDGTRRGTKVVDDEGRELEGVQSVKWEFQQQESQTKATIELEGVGLIVKPDAEKEVL